MKIMIIGANGKQGHMLCQEACNRGHCVTAVVLEDKPQESRVSKVIKKSLFDLCRQDVLGHDVVISAFGSGFTADPRINRQAVDHLIDIGRGTGIRFIFVGGAGSLYTDKTHRTRVFEMPDHPAFLKDISEQMALGRDDLFASEGMLWTYVSPSLQFDYEGKACGEWQIGGEEVLYNESGESYISYADYAAAVITECEEKRHINRHITICGRREKG